MKNNLLQYYQEELSFLRSEGQNFANEYPEIAQRIDISNNIISADPQTERMLESFAFMIAGLRSKIECNTDNISRYISEALYPGLSNVFPSCAIVQFKQNSDTNNIDILKFDKGTILQVNTDEDSEYLMSTIYPINIYPIQIDKIHINDKLQLSIEISTLSVPIENIKLDSILFHINTNVLEKALELYNILFNKDINAFMVINNIKYNIPKEFIKLYGFESNETVVPVDKFFNYSFQMIKDLLLYPQKFLFFKIMNLNTIFIDNNINNIYNFTIIFRLDKKIDIDNNCILINAVPVVNLLPCSTEAFRMDGTKDSYHLVPSHPDRNNLEIHSIKSLHIINNDNGEERELPKYFNVCQSNIQENNNLYWLQNYNSNNKVDETYISIVDTKLDPNREYSDIVYAKTLCINKLSSKYISLSSHINLIQSGKSSNTSVKNVAKFISAPSESIHNNLSNNDNWKLLQYLAFNKISKNNYSNIKVYLENIIKLYESPYKKSFLQVVNNINEVETNTYLKRKLINNKHCFIKHSQLIMHYNMDKTNNYYFLFFKVIEKYLQNINQFNTIFSVKVLDSK